MLRAHCVRLVPTLTCATSGMGAARSSLRRALVARPARQPHRIRSPRRVPPPGTFPASFASESPREEATALLCAPLSFCVHSIALVRPRWHPSPQRTHTSQLATCKPSGAAVEVESAASAFSAPFLLACYTSLYHSQRASCLPPFVALIALSRLPARPRANPRLCGPFFARRLRAPRPPSC